MLRVWAHTFPRSRGTGQVLRFRGESPSSEPSPKVNTPNEHPIRPTVLSKRRPRECLFSNLSNLFSKDFFSHSTQIFIFLPRVSRRCISLAMPKKEKRMCSPFRFISYSVSCVLISASWKSAEPHPLHPVCCSLTPALHTAYKTQWSPHASSRRQGRSLGL